MSKAKQDELHGHDLRMGADCYSYNATDVASKCTPGFTQGRKDLGLLRRTPTS